MRVRSEPGQDPDSRPGLTSAVWGPQPHTLGAHFTLTAFVIRRPHYENIGRESYVFIVVFEGMQFFAKSLTLRKVQLQDYGLMSDAYKFSHASVSCMLPADQPSIPKINK